jgi:uncharacterized protein
LSIEGKYDVTNSTRRIMVKIINIIAIVLLIIGGLNWGSIGIFNFNFVGYVFEHIYLDRIIYTLVGIAAVYVGVGWKFVAKGGKR